MTEKREIEIALRSRGAELSADRLNKKVKGVGTSADTSEKSMLNLSKAAAAVGAALVTRQVVQYADAWTNVNNRLRAATKTNDEFITAQKGVISIAQEAGVSIAGVADSYSRLSQATSELGVSQERVLTVTRNVALALKAGGATAQEVSSIAVQLGQGLGAGALQGDELRSILESSIPIAKALAKEFNTTTGELKKLGADGKLTSERVVSALENMDAKALTFTKDITGGFTEVSNALTVYVGGIDESLGATEAITGSLSSLAGNIDVIIEGATTLAILIGARYAGAIGVAAVSQLTLTAATLKGTVSMNAMGVVTARTTVAMNTSALAARGLSAAMAFIGGPVGLAVIAAAGLYLFATSAETAEEKTIRLADEVNFLADSFKNLSKNRKATLLNETEAEMKSLSDQLVVASTKLNQFKKFSDSPVKSQGVARYTEEVRALNGQMDALARKQEALTGAPDLSGGIERNFIDGVETPKKVKTESDTKSFDSLLARLQLETEAIKSEEEVRREFRAGLLTQNELDNALAMQGIFFNYEARRVAILENEKITAEQRKELISEINAQEVAAEQAKQAELTVSTQEGSNERSAIAEREAAATRSMLISTAVSAFGLTQNANKAMTKEQKKQAKKSIAINTAASIARAYGENNFYVATGMAVFLAGMGLIQTNKASTASGISAPSGGPSTPSAPPTVSNQQTAKTINFVGLENFGPNDFIPMTKAQFIDYMGQDEDVNVAINSGQQSATRVGAI